MLYYMPKFQKQSFNNIEFKNTEMSYAHNSIHVRCSMDEPIQILMDKLSTKSSDLYIFWQNYNQMYISYNEKLTEITNLKEQIRIIKSQRIKQHNPQQHHRIKLLEHQNNELKMEVKNSHIQIERLRHENANIHAQKVKIIEQSSQFQSLINQLRNQNTSQKNTIEKILTQLKIAQNQLITYSKVYEDSIYKQTLINKFIQRQNQLQECILDRDDQIEQLLKENRDMRNKYESILQESMQNAKNKFEESLPLLIRNSKKRLHVVSN